MDTLHTQPQAETTADPLQRLRTIAAQLRIESASMREPEGGVVAELAAELEEASGHAVVCVGVDARIALLDLYRAIEPWLDECWNACERAHAGDGPQRKRKPIDDRFLALVEAMEQAQTVLPKNRTGEPA